MILQDYEFYRTENGVLYNGEVLEVLKSMPDESVNCVITSPPYWGLRDYQTGKWVGGVLGCNHINGTLASDKSGLNDGKGVGENVKLRTTGMPYKDICGKCGAKRIDKQLGLEKIFDCEIKKNNLMKLKEGLNKQELKEIYEYFGLGIPL